MARRPARRARGRAPPVIGSPAARWRVASSEARPTTRVSPTTASSASSRRLDAGGAGRRALRRRHQRRPRSSRSRTFPSWISSPNPSAATPVDRGAVHERAVRRHRGLPGTRPVPGRSAPRGSPRRTRHRSRSCCSRRVRAWSPRRATNDAPTAGSPPGRMEDHQPPELRAGSRRPPREGRAGARGPRPTGTGRAAPGTGSGGSRSTRALHPSVNRPVLTALAHPGRPGRPVRRPRRTRPRARSLRSGSRRPPRRRAREWRAR